MASPTDLPDLDPNSADDLFDELSRTAKRTAQHRLLCDKVMEQTVPIADRLALRFRRRGIASDDLQQVARAALVAATRRFEGTTEREFLGYVIPCIRGELKRHFRDAGWMVRPPRRLQEARQAIGRATEELTMKLGREPSYEEVVNASGLEPDLVTAATNTSSCFFPESLDAPLVDEHAAGSRADSLGELDAGFDQAEIRVLLRPLLKRLEPRDRQLVALRFFADLTQDEVGRRMGLSQMQISRREKAILTEMRQALSAAVESAA